MKRSIRLCLFTLLLFVLALPLAYGEKPSGSPVGLAGTIPSDSVMVLLKEVPYYVSDPLIIKGTLIVEPGAWIEFYEGGRIIVGTGGRLIADGFAQLERKPFPVLVTNQGMTNYFGGEGWASMRCFLFPAIGGDAVQYSAYVPAAPSGPKEVGVRERTIHPTKYNTIFNVGINAETRKIVNIPANAEGVDGANNAGVWTGLTSGFQNIRIEGVTNPNVYVVPFETALLFAAARLEGVIQPGQHSVQSEPWSRNNGTTANIYPDTITFIGQPNAPQSDEYGHIIVLPGARAAFFRNCTFESIRKDTMIDRDAFYSATGAGGESIHPRWNIFSDIEKNEALATLNNEMISLTNGGGGAITTFSSRTWLLDCNFNKNFAKLRGGAVQILQAPTLAFFNNSQALMEADTVGQDIQRYDFTDPSLLRNKYVTDYDETTSSVLTRHTFSGKGSVYPDYPAIDWISTGYTDAIQGEEGFFANDTNRAPWDDARLAGYFGRFRNLTFTGNMVRLANVAILKTPDGASYHGDDTINAVHYPHPLSDEAAGGALYISGTGDEGREIEFGLGVNEALGLGSDVANIAQSTNPNNIADQADGMRDYIRFEGNSAQNYQKDRNSGGAKGGAIYVGKNTSLIVAGEFINNFTSAKFLVDTEGDGVGSIGDGAGGVTDFTYPPTTYYTDGYNYSRGGAIYSDPNNGRLQVRGDRNKNRFKKFAIEVAAGHNNLTTRDVSNSTIFSGNRSGVGGAIFVNTSTAEKEGLMSPYVGGGPGPDYNNFGANIQFHHNHAYVAGGAIYTERNMAVYGAGGEDAIYNYPINYFVRFDTNSAGFAGGAVHIEIPNTDKVSSLPNTHVVNLERARFTYNNVNEAAKASAAHINNAKDVIDQVRGGGAMYVRNASLNVVKSSQFEYNSTYNSNGGAIATVNPDNTITRYFLTDLDKVSYAPAPTNPSDNLPGLPGIANSYQSINNPFTYGAGANRTGWYKVEYPVEEWRTTDMHGVVTNGELTPENLRALHTRMLTKFENNIASVDSAIGQLQIAEYGNTQISDGYIMPDNTFNTQWWFSKDDGFIGGANGWMNRISLDNNNNHILWTTKYNHTHVAADGIGNWDRNSFTAMYFHSRQLGFLADNQGDIWKYELSNVANPESKTIKRVTYVGAENQPSSITSMTFAGASADLGLAVASNGKIYEINGGNTTGAGTTWQPITTADGTGVQNNKRLNKIHIVSNTRAYTVGEQGAFIKMSRNLQSDPWTLETKVIPSYNGNLTGVFFIDENKGYIIGEEGMLMVTTNGGSNWSRVQRPLFAEGETLTDIKFYISDIGYIISNVGNLYKTTDGGTSWVKMEEYTWDSRYSPKSIQVLNEDLVFVVGAHDLVSRSTDGGATWTNGTSESWNSMHPTEIAIQEGNPRIHGGISNLVENGVGLGGALYVLNNQIHNREVHKDYFQFNRVRVQDNTAFSGSAIYSDNYNLLFKFERSLIRGNVTDTLNTIGKNQNLINGPIDRGNEYSEENLASSDLAAATVYGELVNAFVDDNHAFSTRANSIYENEARFLVRYPDVPNTKGVLVEAGGMSGRDTIVGNYWGKTEANVGLRIMNRQGDIGQIGYERDRFMTFFVEKRANGKPLVPDHNYLPYYNDTAKLTLLGNTVSDFRRQGPFEYNHNDYEVDADRGIHKYTYIELDNVLEGGDWDEDTAKVGTIPEKWLFSSDIYDLHDKGLNVKVSDYSKRRMFPIEDFAVGGPVQLKLDDEEYTDDYDLRDANLTEKQYSSKYVKRYIYNPEYSHKIRNVDGANIEYENPELYQLNSGTWRPLKEETVVAGAAPRYYHPLGMPLYLEAKANWYDRIDVNSSNFDLNHQSSTVFFIINETTLDYIRVDLKQIPTQNFMQDGEYAYRDTLSGLDERFRATVFFVPDSSDRGSIGLTRRNAERLRSWGSDGLFPFYPEGSTGPQILNALSPRTLDGGYTEEGIELAANNEDFGALHGRKYSVVSSPDRIYFNMADWPVSQRDEPIRELFPNRAYDGVTPHMPDDNDWYNGVEHAKTEGTNTTFFGGERYGTLPVNAGDVIRVVSRSVLWKQGPERAYEGGLVFQIHEGPEAPEFVGDVSMWGDTLRNPYLTDTNGRWPITPGRPGDNGLYTPDTIRNYGLLNKVFVRTNRWYPWDATHGEEYASQTRTDNDRGTNFILKATAIDRNNFYDPRHLLNLADGQYMGLIYRWRVAEAEPARSGLSRWLSAGNHYETIQVENNDVKGYLQFKGYPINPYIVPGGEKIRLSVRNYAPGVEMLDSIKTVTTNQDTIAWFYQTFPPYLNSPHYNQDVNGNFDETARYLQQDTMGARASSLIESDDITIFVMDSLPRFIDYKPVGAADVPATFLVKSSLYTTNVVEDTLYEPRDYTWTFFRAGTTASKDDNAFSGKFKVNFAGIPNDGASHQLRFKMDINTDDELEDMAAYSTLVPWHFPYGRTAYSFENTAINGEEGNDADTVDSDIRDNLYNVMQLKPSWMDYAYFQDWTPTDAAPTSNLNALMHFQRHGQINLRMDSASVNRYFKRNHITGEQYNVDTMMSIVCNDGHGGLSSKYIDLYVNFQPRILPVELPIATEGMEYNIKRDSSIAIKIYDANQDQRHTYRLLYEGEGITEWILDPAFPEETRFVFPANEGWCETPTWLSIDPVSGVLYGKTGIVTDLSKVNTYITVLVMDEDSLYTIERIPFQQATGNCPPTIVAVDATMDCIVRGQDVNTDVIVFDRDLIRTGTELEELTFSVLVGDEPANSILALDPTTLPGPIATASMGYDTIKLVHVGTSGLVIPLYIWESISGPDGDFILPVRLIVTDAQGVSDTFVINLRIADEVDFLSKITITNNLGSSQVLEWGVGEGATTGMETGAFGILDDRYCEIEVPPFPPADEFDARWSITGISGIHRNIYPRVTSEDTKRLYVYAGTVNSGSVNGNQGDNYPLTYQWDMSTVPAPGDINNPSPNNPSAACWYLRDAGSAGAYFYIRMYDGAVFKAGHPARFDVNTTTGIATLTIVDNTISPNFHIVYDSHVDIEDTDNYTTAIHSVSPSPVYSGQTDANIEFSLSKSGDISIEMFDVLGNKVIAIANAYYSAGSHNLSFNLSDSRNNRLSSGAYTIRLTAGVEVKQFKLIVLQ